MEERVGAPVPPRLRIVVVGNSTAMYVRPYRRGRADGSYGEVLERRLRERGVAAEMVNEARWWDMVHQLFPRVQERVLRHAPDVTIVNYGMGECQPNVFPTTLQRFVTTWHPNLHPAARLARRAAIRPLYRFMVWFMPRASRVVGLRTWRLPPARFESELRRLVTFVRRETGGLVLLLTLNPPGPFLRNLMPGIEERAVRYNEIVARVVHDVDDPAIQLVEAGAVVEDGGWRRTMTDGLHYTARGHREVAELLEQAVMAWMKTEA